MIDRVSPISKKLVVFLNVTNEYKQARIYNSRGDCEEYLINKKVIPYLYQNITSGGSWYNKLADSSIVLDFMNINDILDKCPRFIRWMKRLIEVVNKV